MLPVMPARATNAELLLAVDQTTIARLAQTATNFPMRLLTMVG